MEEEEEKIAKGDDVIIDLDASLEDLYMGGSQKVCILTNIYIYTNIPYNTWFLYAAFHNGWFYAHVY